MKAILVIDLDDDVKLEDTVIVYVVQNCYTGYPYKAEVEGVDLKPMPEPKYAKATDDDVFWGEAIGWNMCLLEIENESNISD